jgi:DtxR family transcriptional regulator, Mn-dependent transcriptional regulator
VQKETVENYLKTIYHLSKGNTHVVTNKQLSDKLGVIPATVTEAVKKLDGLGLVTYEKSYGTRLTSQGTRQALAIVRRHRIWETYLANELGFGWDEVHEIAEQLEHVTNDKLIRKLAEKLGNPVFDPHGDPIPDEKGKIQKSAYIMLSESKAGKKYVLSGVSDHSPVFLKFLDKNNLKIGDQLKVLEIEDFDGSVLIQRGTKELRLSAQMVGSLLVH